MKQQARTAGTRQASQGPHGQSSQQDPGTGLPGAEPKVPRQRAGGRTGVAGPGAPQHDTPGHTQAFPVVGLCPPSVPGPGPQGEDVTQCMLAARTRSLLGLPRE